MRRRIHVCHMKRRKHETHKGRHIRERCNADIQGHLLGPNEAAALLVLV
jgi:hypothetical protein